MSADLRYSVEFQTKSDLGTKVVNAAIAVFCVGAFGGLAWAGVATMSQGGREPATVVAASAQAKEAPSFSELMKEVTDGQVTTMNSTSVDDLSKGCEDYDEKKMAADAKKFSDSVKAAGDSQIGVAVAGLRGMGGVRKMQRCAMGMAVRNMKAFAGPSPEEIEERRRAARRAAEEQARKRRQEDRRRRSLARQRGN